jgi:hypothetical protein
MSRAAHALSIGEELSISWPCLIIHQVLEPSDSIIMQGHMVPKDIVPTPIRDKIQAFSEAHVNMCDMDWYSHRSSSL